MTTSETALPKPSPDVLVTELPDRESVLLDLKTEAYFGLNELGTAVWSVLADGGDLDALIASVAERTGESAEIVGADVRALLDELRARNLVTEG